MAGSSRVLSEILQAPLTNPTIMYFEIRPARAKGRRSRAAWAAAGLGTSGKGVAATAPEGGSTLGAGGGGVKVPVRTISPTCSPSKCLVFEQGVGDDFQFVAIVVNNVLWNGRRLR